MTIQQLIDKLNAIEDKSIQVYREDYKMCDNFLIEDVVEIFEDQEYYHHILLIDKFRKPLF